MSSAKVELGDIFKKRKTIRDAITEGLLTAGHMIEDLASQLAPVGDDNDDHLKDSGDVKVLDDMLVEVSFGNNLNDVRAVAQEFGAYNVAAERDVEPQPYLGPAAKEIDVAEEVAKSLRKVFK